VKKPAPTVDRVSLLKIWLQEGLMIDVFPTKAEANMTINVPLGWHERYNI
jgi:hypothetical protein